MQILFIAIPNVSFCIFESTWVTNDESIAMKGQNLKFHFLVESLGCYLGEKSRPLKNRSKHVIFTNWTILNKKETNFSKYFLDHSKSVKTEAAIFHEPPKLWG